MRQTKIVATISDQRCEVDFIRSLHKAGMNVARLNTAHITTETARMVVNNIRSVSDKIAIIIDTKGPEIRTCSIQNDLEVAEGEEIAFSFSPVSTVKNVCVNYEGFVDNLNIGNKILIDDGDIAVTVKEKHGDYLLCRVENAGVIKKKKSVNVPGVEIKLPSLSTRDIEFIHFAIEEDVDFIAHSFVRNKSDVKEVQKILDEHESKIKIIAKIENMEGVEKIDEILESAYGIMVARGDLGIELPEECLPAIQRDLVRKAMLYKKPVIIATQMLHSMIDHPRPTRAEVSDVASAIYMGTDAIMLSGETAYGKYPVDAVKVMNNIAEKVEPDRDKRELLIPLKPDIPAYLAQSAIRAARELKPDAIVTTTTTGKTGRYLAAHRSFFPVFVKCHSQRVVRELALSFGIHPSYLEAKKNKMKIQKAAIQQLVTEGTIQMDDLVIYVGGRFGEDAGASFIEISTAQRLFIKPADQN
ncbi:pyruvate kinase [Maribellus sp. YY47]|uniref:pyruvate kinase n=1 Tax=Maribellus sp. YY47 TaxID=2929486 RepID=UPI00200154F2|nr:pyruvate kinase [Maribellus sp. YY47]MCK3685197.1 pyruvate kinase [Maribellus sp. YY47]